MYKYPKFIIIVLESAEYLKTYRIDDKYPIENVTFHPEYQPGSLYHNLALVELSENINFNVRSDNSWNYSYPRLLCLDVEQNMTDNSKGPLPPRKRIQSKKHSKKHSKHHEIHQLKTMDLPLSKCQIQKHNEDHLNLGNHVKSPMCYNWCCNFLSRNGSYELLNLIGFSSYCGGPLDLMSKIGPYVEWIEQIIWPDSTKK